MIGRERLAWAAGFIDGEGCIGVYSVGANRTSYALKLAVEQTDRRPLDMLAEILGVGRVAPVARKPRHGCRPTWRWNCYAGEAADALAALHEFLILKRDQATAALEFRGKQESRIPFSGKEYVLSLSALKRVAA